MSKEQIDFWGDRLGILYGGYNSGVDQNILDAAKLIVASHKAYAAGKPYLPMFCLDIAKALELSEEYVELIQYILASVKMPVPENEVIHHTGCFCYGTSPRGLFVDNLPMAEKFIQEFEEYMERQWGDEDDDD